MSKYTVTENGTIEFDWEKLTPEEIKEQLAKETEDVSKAA